MAAAEKGMELKQELITPKKAEEMLKLNTKNRTLRSRHIRKLQRAIENGEWDPRNPVPVVINGRRLLDGQHRLAAVIEAEKPVKMWVWRGAPGAVMSTIDTGLTRTLTDTLKLNDEPYPPVLAGVLRQVFLYRTERVLGGKTERIMPSHQELLKILNEHPELREITRQMVVECSKAELRGLGSPSLVTAIYWIFQQIDKEDAEEYLRGLRTGADLDEGSPILALRRVMTQSRRRPRPRVLGALMIKAWNSWRAGESRDVLIWRATAKFGEKFPEIDGAEDLVI